MKYVDVVIDNKSNNTDVLYTYKCEDDAVRVGSKVYVPFARSTKLREGYAVAVREEPSETDKAILSKLRVVCAGKNKIPWRAKRGMRSTWSI